MTGRAPRAGLALLSLALTACRPPAGDVSGRPEPVEPPGVGATPLAPAACRPTLPEPPTTPAAAGPAYVLVEHVGVLRIADDDVATVVALAERAREVEMAAAPTGELWLSGWDGVDVLGADGRRRNVRQARGGPRYEHLVVRAADDVWAVTSDIEWEVVHYDGTRWQTVRRRGQFPGRFDDNKFVALAVTSEGAWVSSWNGLWRGVGDRWQLIDAPAGAAGALSLWTYRDRVIAGDHARAWLREGAVWRPLAWPQTTGARRAVGEVGLVAAPEHTRPITRLAAVRGEGCAATSEPIAGAVIDALAVDGAGRTWAATDVALAVVDRDGRKLAEWTAGTLPGLSGRVVQVVVIGAGPRRLPAARPARTWEVTGRLTTYKRGAPLADAALELCSSPTPDDRCPPGALVRTATSAADGSFRLVDVPAGDYAIVVRPPADNPDCGGIFRDSGHALAPARDCPSDAGRCDLGTLTDCLPFEMPPPR